ncbi:hypothetical protein [Cylindrospermum sp. FACHB-282]|uniref:hypothetical protein n=1 Tax=Cylindrospermum sp. FACHB-282 TaxID=2692794 RepID=UPI00168693E7|nr:hypothetical protein [Cylindrospermum sp. FACHB-282]MBD2386013.1 hypothetical protein [Cylindrospermum sp. FACHB-282]
MNSVTYSLTPSIPSLANSIIRIKGLQLVWNNSPDFDGDDFDLSDKYLELTGKEFKREEAIAFQHNLEDCWSAYAMQDYVLLFIARERYILKRGEELINHEIDTDALQLCFTCKEFVERFPRAYKIIAGEDFLVRDAIAFHNLYGERTYEMRDYIVVISANNPAPIMDGVWIYKK